MSNTDPYFCTHIDADGDPHYRHCVALRISHPNIDLSFLTRELELEPEVVDRVGEPRIRRGKNYGIAKSSFWVHGFMAPTDHRDFEQFLAEIATLLTNKRDVLRRIVAEGGEAQLYVGFFLERTSAGFDLPYELLRNLSELCLDLSVCIYNWDENDNASGTGEVQPAIITS